MLPWGPHGAAPGDARDVPLQEADPAPVQGTQQRQAQHLQLPKAIPPAGKKTECAFPGLAGKEFIGTGRGAGHGHSPAVN